MSKQEPSGYPEWIVKYTKVVVFTYDGERAQRRYGLPYYAVKTSTIKSVASQSFAVDGESDSRFKLDTQESGNKGGYWDASKIRKVVPLDSEAGRAMVAYAKERKAYVRAADLAEKAFAKWRESGDERALGELKSAVAAVPDPRPVDPEPKYAALRRY